MDKRFNRMDTCSKHCGPLTRERLLIPPVESIGWFSHKKQHINHSFPGCNFSFILEGAGSYLFKGVRCRVQAPCVLLQWPGAPMDYGPDDEWTELYMIYNAECYEMLTRSRVFDIETPVRPFRLSKDFSLTMEHLFSDIFESDNIYSPDRADLLCWGMIENSFSPPDEIHEPDFLHIVRSRLERAFEENFDVEQTAAECGMSLSSLRRHWAKRYGNLTFTEYRNAYFLQESRRLLIETSLSMKELAGKLGFHDSYYFSRKFHHLAGETPTQYRERHCLP